MPTLSIITATSGWFLAERTGFLDLNYPEFWWVVASLVIVAVLTVQGLGYLLPTNLRIYFELQKPTPDLAMVARWMRVYFGVVASQGAIAGRYHHRHGALCDRAVMPMLRRLRQSRKRSASMRKSRFFSCSSRTRRLRAWRDATQNNVAAYIGMLAK